MKKLEISILIINFIFLLLWIFGWLLAKKIFLVLFLLISLYYLFFGFAYYQPISIQNLFKRDAYSNLPKGAILKGIFTGINYFFLLICILFQFMLWPGAFAMANSGAIFTLPILILLFYRLSKGGKLNANSHRSLIFSGLMLVLFLMPPSMKLSVFYQTYPNSLKDAYSKYFDSPSPENWEEVSKELIKAEN